MGECCLSMEFSRGLGAATKYVPKDELVMALDALKGIAKKGDEDIVSALKTATELLKNDHQDENISFAVGYKKILPELVAILKKPCGESAYRAALHVLGSIINWDKGRYVQAAVDARACPVLVRIIELPLGPLLGQALSCLSLITDKVPIEQVFPEPYSLKALIDVAEDHYRVCLELINKLLQDKNASKIGAEDCVRFLYTIYPKNAEIQRAAETRGSGAAELERTRVSQQSTFATMYQDFTSAICRMHRARPDHTFSSILHRAASSCIFWGSPGRLKQTALSK